MVSFISNISHGVCPKIVKGIKIATEYNLDKHNREKVVMYASAVTFGLSAFYMAITAYLKDKVSQDEKKFALIQGIAEGFVNVSFAIIMALVLKSKLNSHFFKGKILPKELSVKNLGEIKKIESFVEKFQDLAKKELSENKILAALIGDKAQIKKLNLTNEEVISIKKQVQEHFKLEKSIGLEDALSDYHSGINQIFSSILGSIIAFNVFAMIVKNNITHWFIKKDNNKPTNSSSCLNFTASIPSKKSTSTLTPSTFEGNLISGLNCNQDINTKKVTSRPLLFNLQSRNNNIDPTFNKFINY